MSLLFPAYLLGLLALGLPWILHRFSDQQPLEKLFPSKRFLEPTTPPVSRKRSLRYKLLLAMRLLGLLLLCFLFAQPWLNKDSLPEARQRHHMIALDQSLSMRTEGTWDIAQDKARQLISELESQSVELLVFDRRVTVVASNTPVEQGGGGSLSDALEELKPGFSPGDYGLLMQRVDRLAAEKELPVKLWLISDMQNTALPSQLNALYAPNIKALELLPVDRTGQMNVHLIAEAHSADGATATVRASLFASIDDLDSAQADVIRRTVQVSTSERVLEQRVVSLTPGELLVVNFESLVLPAQSNPQITVSLLEADALMDDNSHTLPITERRATGFVLLQTPGSTQSSASVFTTTALETDAMARVESILGSAVQVSPDTANLIAGRDLSAPVDMDVLQFVDTGRNALVFNTPGTPSQSKPRLEGSGIGSMDEAHPLALGDIAWSGIQFFDLPELTVEDDDRVLLKTAEGKSVLVERATNRGRLLILNDPLDGLASNLPLHPAFVELMHSVVRYFDASTAVPDQVVVGQRLALPANVQLINAAGETLLDIEDRAQATTVELAEPGLYTVVSARGEQSLRAVLDSRETDITRLSGESVTAWQARFSESDNVDTADALDATDSRAIDTRAMAAGDDPLRRTLWQWILLPVALLLVVEGWFANRHLNVRRDGS